MTNGECSTLSIGMSLDDYARALKENHSVEIMTTMEPLTAEGNLYPTEAS